MHEQKYTISCDSFENCFAKGFARLQQNGEFVDMTLAAEGHLVKVHKNVVALSSPYLKAMLQSASCDHPVIFLNNVSFTTLGFILEYIYTGEVMIPFDNISGFFNTCKDLSINVVKHVVIQEEKPKEPKPGQEEQLILLNDEQKILPNEQPDMQPNVQKQKQSTTLQHVELPVDQSDKQSDVHLELLSKEQLLLNQATHLEEQSDKLPKLDISIQGQLEKQLDVQSEDLPKQQLENQSGLHEDVELTKQADIPLGQLQKQLPLQLEDHIEPVIRLEEQKEKQSSIALDDLPVKCLEKLSKTQEVIQLEGLPVEWSKVSGIEQANVNLEVQQSVNPIEPVLSEVQQVPNTALPMAEQLQLSAINLCENDTIDKNFAAHITINSDNYNLEISTLMNNMIPVPVTIGSNINNKGGIINDTIPIMTLPVHNINPDVDLQCPLVFPIGNISQLATTCFETNPNVKEIEPNLTKNVVSITKLSNVDKDQVLYTISNRGAIQLILNHYIYCCHHQSKEGRMRRWRCMMYRRAQCRAVIDTDNNEIINRSEDHCHSSAESKILKKIKSKLVYSSIMEANEIADKLNSTKQSKDAIEYRKPQKNNRKRKRNSSDSDN